MLYSTQPPTVKEKMEEEQKYLTPLLYIVFYLESNARKSPGCAGGADSLKSVLLANIASESLPPIASAVQPFLRGGGPYGLTKIALWQSRVCSRSAEANTAGFCLSRKLPIRYIADEFKN